MIKHIILWKLKDFSESEKEQIKKNAKEGLESLKGKIDGLIDIKVNINGLETSNCDMMLDSTFKSFEDLKNYCIENSINLGEWYQLCDDSCPPIDIDSYVDWCSGHWWNTKWKHTE